MVTSGLNSLVVILNFGSLILLSFLMFINPLKVNRIANLWFGALLLLWASFWIDEVVMLVFRIEISNIWQFIFRFFQYFSPMMLYISVIHYSNPGFRFKRTELLHLILPFFYTLMLCIFYFGEHQSIRINFILILIMLGQNVFYSLASWLRIRKHQRKVLLFSSDTSEIDLSWLERIIVVMLLMVLVVITYNIFFMFKSLNLFMNMVLFVVIYYVAYHSLRQREIYPFSDASREEIISLESEPENGESKKKIISDDEIINYKSQLNQFMINRKPFLDPDMNLIKLAELFGTTSHRLSYIINTGFNKNFFNFINMYRVEEAKSMLLDPKMEQYSVLGVAFEAGFNSKTSFNKTFKQVTGVTPTDFKKSSPVL
jgi:AraC-like DNA-binding protein